MKIKHLIPSGLALLTLMLSGQSAMSIDLANEPVLGNSGINAKPNVFFMLDNSGSMSWEHMPDETGQSSGFCRSWTASGGNNDKCFAKDNGSYNRDYGITDLAGGDAPYLANKVNGVFYSPEVYYKPPLTPSGSTFVRKTSMTAANTSNWTSVPKNGYYASSANYNLATGFPEAVYCKNSTDSVTGANCVNQNSTYTYPDSTYDTRRVRAANPVYYTISPREYCTTAKLDVCTWSTTATGSYVYAAPVRFCQTTTYASTGSAVTGNNAGTPKCQKVRDASHTKARYGLFNRISIVSTTTSYTKYTNRTDCAGTSCTYAEEMTNFANWFAYYRTRMMMMKAGAGEAFSNLTDDYRVAFNTIHDTTFSESTTISTAQDDGGNRSVKTFLHMRPFDATQRQKFYDILYAMGTTGSTPLRGALSSMGQYYAGQIVTGANDPVEYSCQRNFGILTTDGYWNDDSSDAQKIDGTQIGDMDNSTTTSPRPMYDGLSKSPTLADVARYYYLTDLRTATSGATGAYGANVYDNIVPAAGGDNATWQHMTLYTLGLGANGSLVYAPDYLTGGSPDYTAIAQGTLNWPDPINNSSGQRIDDLWHAAVNANGKYFSATDPDALVDGLNDALSSITAIQGAGAAAATTTLNPVAGDNAVYIAQYTTQQWWGNLIAMTIDPGTGAISATSPWTADGATLLDAKSSAASDTRTIYTFDSSATNKLKAFLPANFTSTEKTAWFNPANLSQYATMDIATKAAMTSDTLINYLRGHTGMEDETVNILRGYRGRTHILGDIVNAEPVYVKAPPFAYGDTGYTAFKTANSSRQPVVFAASNDGMLHAFNATNGNELWAYVPPMALPNMYKTADFNYENNHQFLLNGTPVMADIYDGSSWKTILISGMGRGGRGYYALDVTDPTTPKGLWNFTSSDDSDLQLTYGLPLVGKRADGTWVTIFGSGYSSTGSAPGRVYVLNANTGAMLDEIAASGSDGIAQLSAWVDNGTVDNTIVAVYGGDLNGSIWRFDINGNVGPTGKDAFELGQATVSGVAQSITTAPELMNANGKKAVYVATGRLLGNTDMSNTTVQTIYAVKDDFALTSGHGVLRNASANLVQKVINTSNVMTSDPTVDWTTKNGWYLDMPRSGERNFVEIQIVLGKLLVASYVPTGNACKPDGTSNLYNCSALTGSCSGVAQSDVIVGMSLVQLANGQVVVIKVFKGQATQSSNVDTSGPSSGGVPTALKRMNWREIINE